MAIQPSGYSGTPLAKELGIKDGFHISLINSPAYYMELFTDMPNNIALQMKQALTSTLSISSPNKRTSLLPYCQP